jgi:hypothetical protein
MQGLEPIALSQLFGDGKGLMGKSAMLSACFIRERRRALFRRGRGQFPMERQVSATRRQLVSQVSSSRPSVFTHIEKKMATNVISKFNN